MREAGSLRSRHNTPIGNYEEHPVVSVGRFPLITSQDCDSLCSQNAFLLCLGRGLELGVLTNWVERKYLLTSLLTTYQWRLSTFNNQHSQLLTCQNGLVVFVCYYFHILKGKRNKKTAWSVLQWQKAEVVRLSAVWDVIHKLSTSLLTSLFALSHRTSMEGLPDPFFPTQTQKKKSGLATQDYSLRL